MIAGSIVYIWVRNGIEPPIPLWLILVGVALIPLAERLKIGGWFDFTKKVENLGKEVSSTQREVDQLSSQLSAFMANVQGQQQFNIALQGREAAEAFAKSIPLTHGLSYPPSGEAESSFEKEGSIDWEKLFFISVADEALASVRPLIRILYATMIAKQEKRLASAEAVYSKTVVSMIEELPPYIEDVFGPPGYMTDTIQQYLRTIRTLVELRENVSKGSTKPPSVEEGQKLIEGVNRSVGYFEAILSTFAALLLVPEMRGSRVPRDIPD